MKDFSGGLIIIITICVIFCSLLTKCVNESKIVHIKKINDYDLVELEDGHQYLKLDSFYSHSLEHYIDCPKCKTNK